MLWFLLLLAIIQGLTEFLPISSSGHLALIQNLAIFQKNTQTLGSELLFSIDIMLHFATLGSIILFFHKEIWKLIHGFFAYIFLSLQRASRENQTMQNPKEKYLQQFQLAIWIVIANIPVGVVGLLFKKNIESLFTKPIWIAILFLINGLVLISTRYATKGQSSLFQINLKQSIIVGLMQTIAILPGISRSGSTISGGLWAGIKGSDAARFSFLLGLPAVAGASLLEARHLFDRPLPTGFTFELTLSMIVAFITGLLALKILVWLVEKTILYPFGIYTFCLGLSILLFW